MMILPPSSSEMLLKEHMYCGSSALTLPKQHPAPPAFFRPGLASAGERGEKHVAATPRPPSRAAFCVCVCVFGRVCADFRLQVVLLYHGQQVLKVTTKSPDGCFILQGQVPLGNERIYGPCSAQLICFPSPAAVSLPSHLAEPMSRLLCHLERGVLLWMGPEGLFIKRFCQGRVYWSGPLARNTDQPNKLEREKTFKLFDANTFLSGESSCTAEKRIL